MGTGIVAILLHNLPYQFLGLHYIAIAIFILNIALFAMFVVISVLRYVLWPGKFSQLVNHPVKSMSIGALPMGFATIVNMTAYICIPAWGSSAETLVWVMWWIDVVLSVAICFYLPFVL